MKRMKLAIAMLLAMTAGPLTAQTIERDIPYSANTDTYSRERCRLDVYSPDGASQAPVVVWFHGGGLTGGAKELPHELTDAGYVVIGVNYRLLPNVTLDCCIDDAAAAVAWAFANASRYGGDTSKLFVAGHSAGGYLTSMVGLDRRWLAKYGIEADSIAGLIPYSGQAITHFAHRKLKGVSELQPMVDEFAPLYHVRPDAPPYIIISGDRNKELFGRYEENAYLWRMLQLVGHPHVEIYEIGGYDHGSMATPAHHILRDFISRTINKKS